MSDDPTPAAPAAATCPHGCVPVQIIHERPGEAFGWVLVLHGPIAVMELDPERLGAALTMLATELEREGMVPLARASYTELSPAEDLLAYALRVEPAAPDHPSLEGSRRIARFLTRRAMAAAQARQN